MLSTMRSTQPPKKVSMQPPKKVRMQPPEKKSTQPPEKKEKEKKSKSRLMPVNMEIWTLVMLSRLSLPSWALKKITMANGKWISANFSPELKSWMLDPIDYCEATFKRKVISQLLFLCFIK